MHLMLRLPLLTGLLLLADSPFALAESPLLPDPVAPAVIGRPLDEVRPARPLRQNSVAAKPVRPKQAAARTGAAGKVARAPAAGAQVLGAGPAKGASATQRPIKQAVDDRADPRMAMADVGKGTHFARKPLGPGAYFADRHRAAVRKYYESHPVPGAAANWKIGEPVPGSVPLTPVPKGLLASLPQLPPGHRYIQLGGEVVLIASGSRMVVDGISRRPR
jgi:hypothetical protein